jgi:hypothetical protein
MLATCQLKRYHTQFHEVIRSIPISDAVASVNGRVVAGERQGMCELVFKTAGKRYGMCESAFNPPSLQIHIFKIICYTIMLHISRFNTIRIVRVRKGPSNTCFNFFCMIFALTFLRMT